MHNGAMRNLSFMSVGLFFVFFILLLTTNLFIPTSSPFHASLHKDGMILPSPTSFAKNHDSMVTSITGGQGGTLNEGTKKSTSAVDPLITFPAHCIGRTSTPAQLLFYLGPGWTIHQLGTIYQNETRAILCYDHWQDAWSVPGGTWLHISDFLHTMEWPSDLFDPSAGGEILVMALPPQTTTNNPGTTPTGSEQQNGCIITFDLVLTHPQVDICQFTTTFLNETVLQPLKDGIASILTSSNQFLWTTPAADSYTNPTVGNFWQISIGIVNALLAAVIAYGAFRYMISRTFSWLAYADLLELLPRIVFAVLAAYLSAHLCQGIIEGSNALSSVFSSDLLKALQDQPKDILTLVLQILLCLMSILLILEEGIRYSILFILISFSPLWVFASALRETQFLFKSGLRALFFITLLQPCQTMVLDLGQHVITTLSTGSGGNVLFYLISISLMFVVLYMLSIFLRLSGMSMPFIAAGAASLGFGLRVGGKMIRGTQRSPENPKRRAQTPGSAGTKIADTSKKVAGAGMRAYQGVRAAPGHAKTKISQVQARMSKAHQTMTQTYNRTMGITHANPPGKHL